MVNKQLETISAYIKEHNGYFQAAFPHAYTEAGNGVVHNGDPIFPTDVHGNYFYLRVAGGSFSYDQQYAISTTRRGVGIQSDVYLVAMVFEADADKLLDNLVSTLAASMPDQLRFVSFLSQAPAVVQQELSGLEPAIRQAAMQNIPPFTALVSVRFTLTSPMNYTKPNCITSPCTC